MKSFYNLLGIVALGVLGYLAEPKLRFTLTGMRPSAVELGKHTKVILELPGGGAQVDLASLTPDQLPQRVHLNVDVKMSDAASGVVMILPAGNTAKLLRIEAGNAVVSPGEGPFTGLIPVTETDLNAQISANPPTTNPPVKTPPVVPSVVTPTPPPTAPPVTVPPVTPPNGDSEEPVKVIEPPKTPEPPPMPEPAPQPAPPPVPEPAPAVEPAPAATSGPADVVMAMQESIKTAQIKEFTFAQVLDWKAGAAETSDGETYQTGLASYKAETIFGVKTIQAKALIKGGKVVRWVWPKSGMEIK